MSREKEEKHFVPQPEPRRREPEPDLPKRPEAKEAPPVATTREVKDGSWVGSRFRH